MKSVWVFVVGLCLLVTQAELSGGSEDQIRMSPEGIEVLGWDADANRIYYFVNGPALFPPGDTVRVLRYFDLRDPSAQEPRTEIFLTRAHPESARVLDQRLRILRRRLVGMQPSPLPNDRGARKTERHSVQADDTFRYFADFLVDYHGLQGTWRYDVTYCGDFLVLRRIYLTPNGRDGIVILQDVTQECRNAGVLLISDRPRPPMQHRGCP